MSFIDCIFGGFACKEDVAAREKSVADRLVIAKEKNATYTNLLSDAKKKTADIKAALWSSEHYRFMYEDLPEPHDIGLKIPVRDNGIPGTVTNSLKEAFGESATQRETDDPTKFTYNRSGVANWMIPRAVFEKLLNKYPLKLYSQTEGYNPNDVIRFVSEINISLYWNFIIGAVRTKTRWAVTFLAEDNKFYLADPVTKEIWAPDPTKDEDNIEELFI